MNYNIQKEDVGIRLDIYLSTNLEDITRSYIKTLIEQGNILVNNEIKKSGYSLKLNDNIVVELPTTVIDVVAEDIDVKIIYEDEDIIVIDKPKGMVVHPASGNYTGTLVNSLMYSHRDKLSTINGTVRPGIVHRIDKDTTGILVVAKNDNAHKTLSEQFKVHSISRKYIALVKGIVKQDDFDINLPIGRSSKDRKKMAVTNISSKEAITHIRVLSRFYDSHLTLIEATLKTGRTHQIRVHMSYMGYPLLGDEVYGKKDSKYKVCGQMLHAKHIGFIHPTTKKYMEFESDLPDEFSNIISKLK